MGKGVFKVGKVASVEQDNNTINCISPPFISIAKKISILSKTAAIHRTPNLAAVLGFNYSLFKPFILCQKSLPKNNQSTNAK